MEDSGKLNKEIKALFAIMRKIMETNEEYELGLNDKSNVIHTCLNKYMKAYDLTEPMDHLPYFMRVYQKNKIAILRGYEDDNWLRDGNIIIRYGELEGVRAELKLMLSAIYNIGLEIKKRVESNRKGLYKERPGECEELTYTQIFMLHLYRIFKEGLDNNKEKETLTKCINEIEMILNLNDGENNKANENGFGGLINMATNLMSTLNIKPPEGVSMPKEEEVGAAIGSIFNNPQTQNTIGTIFKDISECKDINQILQKLVTGFNNPTIAKAIGDTIGQTALGASKEETFDKIKEEENEVEYETD